MISLPTTRESVSNLDRWFDDALLLGGATAAALLAEHVVLYGELQRLKPPAAYIVGTATIGAGLLGWVARNRQADALTTWLAAGVITAVGGGTVVICYYARDVLERLRASGERGGQLNGRIVATLGRQEGHHGDHRAAPGHRGR